MRRLLIVDDNTDIQELIAAVLGASYQISRALTLAEAEKLVEAGRYDLILLDVSLPDGESYPFCAKLRNVDATRHVPIIFLSGKGGISDKVLGFSLGADDYITKPFNIDELRARVEARLRFSQQIREAEALVVAGDLRIDVNSHGVYLLSSQGETRLDVTPIELKLLAYLARFEEQVFDRDHLVREVWGEGTHLSERAVDSHMSNLRKKIGGSAYTVMSIHGQGYKFTRRDATEETVAKRASIRCSAPPARLRRSQSRAR